MEAKEIPQLGQIKVSWEQSKRGVQAQARMHDLNHREQVNVRIVCPARVGDDAKDVVERDVAALMGVMLATVGAMHRFTKDPPTRVVTIVGSHKDQGLIEVEAAGETLKVNIVIVTGELRESDADLSRFELDCRKVELADEVLVMNCDGEIVPAIKPIIEHAHKMQKTIRFRWAKSYPADECAGQGETAADGKTEASEEADEV